MAFSPKQNRNLARIVPFGIIWLVTGWVFLLAEAAVTGNENFRPSEAITLTLPVFIFASIAVMVVGLLFGAMELFVLERRFRRYSLSRKIVYKFGVYLLLMLLINVVTFPLASSIEYGTHFFDPLVLAKTKRYFTSIVFVNTMVQLSFSMLLSVLYAAVSENLGHHMLFHFFTGRYHRPIKENRVFMFLDMKDSTAIAEQLGHQRYFELLHLYYDTMSDAIINHYGEVYQYIGDEVVVSWKAEAGLENHHCIRCFREIKAALHEKAARFEKQFGLVPDFKAAMHIGEVTTGEIGALKKEIVFTGDVVNTTARIQEQCKKYKVDLIISDALRLALNEPVNTQALGEVTFKGKTQPTLIHAVAAN